MKLQTYPLTKIAGAAHRCILRARVWGARRFPLWRQISRPFALAIAGLTVAVIFWAVSFKLCHFHRHAARSSRAPAYVWIESRDISEAMASRPKGRSLLVHDLQVSSLPFQLSPRLSRAIVSVFPVCRRDVAYFDFLIPFRSPPPDRFIFRVVGTAVSRPGWRYCRVLRNELYIEANSQRRNTRCIPFASCPRRC